MSVASAVEPQREREHGKTAEERSPAAPDAPFFKHSARGKGIGGAQQEIARTDS